MRATGAYLISTRPWRAANTRACSLEWTSSLLSMLTMWVRSVSTVMCSFSAMSLLSRPSPRACSTCFSRGVSFSMALWASYPSWRLRLTIRSISMTTAGESRASPDLSRRTASTTSPIAADLCSTPAAPASTARANRAGSRLALRTSVITSGQEASSSISSNPSPSGNARSTTATSTRSGPLRMNARLGQRACLARHDELLLPLEHEGQRLPERGVILDEQDPGRILPSVILYDSHPCNASMLCPILPQHERARMAPLPFDQAGDGYREAHPRPLARRALHTKLPAELESPVPHRLPT